MALAVVAFSTVAYSHPGVGIVTDSRGNVFYTDLQQVWRVGPHGTKDVAVPNLQIRRGYGVSRWLSECRSSRRLILKLLEGHLQVLANLGVTFAHL